MKTKYVNIPDATPDRLQKALAIAINHFTDTLIMVAGDTLTKPLSLCFIPDYSPIKAAELYAIFNEYDNAEEGLSAVKLFVDSVCDKTTIVRNHIIEQHMERYEKQFNHLRHILNAAGHEWEISDDIKLRNNYLKELV